MSLAPLPIRAPADQAIDRIYESQQRNRAAIGETTAAERINKLRRLERLMLDRRGEIQAAMWEDYRKPPAEVDLAEVFPVLGEARHAIRHLRRWMKPRRVGSRLALLGSRSSIVYQPKGAVLIIAPWNFPFNLTLGPLVSAVAAGNCAILKPSELTPASSACMKRIIGELFDENEIAVIEGDVAVSTSLLSRRFDHVFFTGSPAIGRIVMKAAAEHLSSVTLELGGKSPVLVDRSANVADAARKVAWGKFYNSGQICIAPDYALVHESVLAEFTDALRSSLQAFGAASRSVMVNERHAARVRHLIDASVEAGAEMVLGGGGDGRAIEPTVLTHVPADAPVMQEEIFGPVLPVLTYGSLDEAIDYIAAHEHPLVLYIFSRDRAATDDIVRRTRAGGTVINHTLVHFYQNELPFGGTGHSGMGKAHGVFGFEAFSNARGILDQRLPYSPIEMLFPPYTGRLKQKLIDFTVRWL